MKAQCTNCGDEMNQEASEKWKYFCTKEECKQAAIDSAMQSLKRGKRK